MGVSMVAEVGGESGSGALELSISDAMVLGCLLSSFISWFMLIVAVLVHLLLLSIVT